MVTALLGLGIQNYTLHVKQTSKVKFSFLNVGLLSILYPFRRSLTWKHFETVLLPKMTIKRLDDGLEGRQNSNNKLW